MSKSKKSQVVVDEVADPKTQAIKAKAAKGTTEPLPMAKPAATEEEKKVDEANVALARKQASAIEETRKRLEELKAELKRAKEAEKAERDKEKNAKKAEAEKSLAERAKKAKEIEEADEAIAKAQLDLENTEEWAALVEAKKAREAIGPLPKAPKTSTSKPREPRDPNSTASYGIDRDHDLAWCDKKEALFKALTSLGATSATSAASTSELCEAANLVGRDVRHYSYHAKAGGLVGIAEIDGKKGYCFYLTEAGIAELKKQTS